MQLLIKNPPSSKVWQAGVGAGDECGCVSAGDAAFAELLEIKQQNLAVPTAVPGDLGARFSKWLLAVSVQM